MVNTSKTAPLINWKAKKINENIFEAEFDIHVDVETP